MRSPCLRTIRNRCNTRVRSATTAVPPTTRTKAYSDKPNTAPERMAGVIRRASRYLFFVKLTRRFASLSPQNSKASSTDPHLVNLSVKPAAIWSSPAPRTPLVIESRTIISAVVPPDPVQECVAPFFKMLMPNPTGTTDVMPLRTGSLCFRSIIAVRTRRTSGPGSATTGSSFSFVWSFSFRLGRHIHQFVPLKHGAKKVAAAVVIRHTADRC
jgi:hypothetical protein